MQIELYGADVPYLGLYVEGVQSFIPFRHTLEFFTKAFGHDTWSFDGMDEDEFTPEMRAINDWEWIIALDRAYNHGTMICCMNQTIHGNRFSIHSKKNYRIENNLQLDVSIGIGENGPVHFDAVSKEIERMQEVFPERFVRIHEVAIKPEGRVSVYTMQCLKYTHVR